MSQGEKRRSAALVRERTIAFLRDRLGAAQRGGCRRPLQTGKQTATNRAKSTGRSGTTVQTARYDGLHGGRPRGDRARGYGSRSRGRAADRQGGARHEGDRPAPHRDPRRDHRGSSHAGPPLSRRGAIVLGDTTALRCAVAPVPGVAWGLAIALAHRSRVALACPVTGRGRSPLAAGSLADDRSSAHDQAHLAGKERRDRRGPGAGSRSPAAAPVRSARNPVSGTAGPEPSGAAGAARNSEPAPAAARAAGFALAEPAGSNACFGRHRHVP
jgi:hypothetical protein